MRTMFKPIPSLPGYRAGTDGTIERDWGSSVPIWLRVVQSSNADGYSTVRVRVGGRLRTLYVHRLILEAWRGPCPPGQLCRHLDGDPSNNALGNLKWGTRAENEADKVRHGTANRGERHGMAKLDEDAVKRIRSMRQTGASFAMIGTALGVSSCAARQAANGETWSHVAA